MENLVQVQSWDKGMNQDFNSESAPGTYFEAQNFRLNASDGSQVLGLTNNVCNELIFSLPAGHIIIGTGRVRDTIVLMTTLSTTETGGTGYIWTAEINKQDNSLTALTLKYQNNDLLFSTKRPIEVLGYYENEQYQRIYFSDFKGSTKSVNLVSIDNSFPIEGLSIFPQLTIKSPVIEEIITGGILPVGIYEYFIYFTTIDGKNTLYSPNSNQIHIVKSSESLDNSLAYSGNIELDTAGVNIVTDKAVKVSVNIENIPLNLFSKITLCCISATNTISEPVVRKIEEKIYSDKPVFFIHSGKESSSVIDSTTYSVNAHPFYTNKTFALKENALTFSNVKTQIFDMNWNTQCFRYKGTGETHPEYLNYYNDESGKAYGARTTGTYTNWYNEDQYKYQSDGLTLGGESLDGSISYKFKMIEVVTDENTISTYYTSNPEDDTSIAANGRINVNKTFNSYHSPYMRNLVGYKREEIYRFGIVGIKNGSTSFVSYIGDIKFPGISEVANYATVANTTIFDFRISAQEVSGEVKMYSLGLEFNITPPSGVDIDSYQIVRVPREQSDKTRLATGVITQFFQLFNQDYRTPLDQLADIRHYYGNNTLAGPLINAQIENARRDLINFYSPEITYNSNLPVDVNNNYLKVVSILEDSSKFGKNQAGLNVNNLLGHPNNFNSTTGLTDDCRVWTTKARTTSSVSNPDQEYHLEKIRFYKRSTPGSLDDVQSIGGVDYINYCWYSDVLSSSSTDLSAYGGTALTIKLDVASSTIAPFDQSDTFNDYNINTSDWIGKAFLMDMVNFKQDQYGGQGIESLAYNKFIAITDNIEINDTDKKINLVLGGDTYVGWYEFMKTYWNSTGGAGDNGSFYENVIIPIESSINFELNAGKTLKEGSKFDHDGDGVGENYRSQESGMFIYNPVFSKGFLSRSYFTKPFDFTEQTSFDVRTYISESKIIGENIDSFSKVGINNFADADPKMGSITRSLEFANEVFIIQEQGVCYVQINPQAMVDGGTGVPIVLGSAAGFGNHIYLSHNQGSIHQWACKVLDDGLYFYDSLNKQLGVIRGNQIENLSVSIGMDSFFNKQVYNVNLTKANGGDNPIERKGVHMGFDKQNKELLITFLGSTDDTRTDRSTLVFNTDWKVFSSKYLMYPTIYIEDQVNLYSPDPSNTEQVFIQNLGLPNYFYGVKHKSYVKFYLNAAPESTKLIRFMDYDLVSKDLSGNFVTGEGMDNIRIENNYQDTNTISLTGRQKLRFNRWRIQRLPRNTNQPGKISRMRNDWNLVTLEFNNLLNRFINLERVFSVYNKQ